MIKYHSADLNPAIERQKMAGKHFCVSFAYPSPAEWCIQNAQSVMWDNGAFTAFRKGKDFDPGAFEKWVEPKLSHPHWAVVPDVIDGDEDMQRARIAQWGQPRFLSAPVWHLALSIDWLLELADEWPRICFGSSGAYWQVGSEVWERRCDEAWNALERRGLRPWIHMLRGMDLADDRWPFASVDSSNVAVNYKRNKIDPERMARVIDGRNPRRLRWSVRPEQRDMFAA